MVKEGCHGERQNRQKGTVEGRHRLNNAVIQLGTPGSVLLMPGRGSETM
jgi:hypothetical protein